MGAVRFSAHATVPIPPVAVDLVDTVGAGDAFQAALLTWVAETGRLTPEALAHIDETEMRETLGFAARAAAITCGRRGADLPRRHELV